MTAISAFITTQQEERMRGPVSIAFLLVKRGIVENLDEAYKLAQSRGPRPDISFLLQIGTL